MSKVFGIGFHKTGTTSLGEALSILGYKHYHGGHLLKKELGEVALMKLLFKKEYRPLYNFVDRYDSLNDVPWFSIYKELDKNYPNSKFILTLREEQSWLASSTRYFQNSSSAFRLWLYGQPNPIGNEEIYLKRYRRHNKEVIEYFAERDDLLIIDITEKNKWNKICSFLNKPLPSVLFPFLNNTIKKE